MPKTRRFWQAISIGSEIAVPGIGYLVVPLPRGDLYKILNDNLFLYFSIIWLIFALIHGYVSYKGIKNAPRVWYKEWNLFWGLADACMAGFWWLLALTPEQSSRLNYGNFFLEIFFSFSWVLLMVWSVLVVRKYPNL
jgi:hypothetical protein